MLFSAQKFIYLFSWLAGLAWAHVCIYYKIAELPNDRMRVSEEERGSEEDGEEKMHVKKITMRMRPRGECVAAVAAAIAHYAWTAGRRTDLLHNDYWTAAFER